MGVPFHVAGSQVVVVRAQMEVMFRAVDSQVALVRAQMEANALEVAGTTT